MGGPALGARIYCAGAVAILVLAALLRFWALDSGLPNIHTRPDETEVIHWGVCPQCLAEATRETD